MGEAKRRGTFEERKAVAIEKKQASDAERKPVLVGAGDTMSSRLLLAAMLGIVATDGRRR